MLSCDIFHGPSLLLSLTSQFSCPCGMDSGSCPCSNSSGSECEASKSLESSLMCNWSQFEEYRPERDLIFPPALKHYPSRLLRLQGDRTLWIRPLSLEQLLLAKVLVFVLRLTLFIVSIFSSSFFVLFSLVRRWSRFILKGFFCDSFLPSSTCVGRISTCENHRWKFWSWNRNEIQEYGVQRFDLCHACSGIESCTIYLSFSFSISASLFVQTSFLLFCILKFLSDLASFFFSAWIFEFYVKALTHKPFSSFSCE